MTAATEDRNTERKDGIVVPYSVVTNDCIYAGTLVSVNAEGYAVPGADTLGQIFQGVAEARADNTGGANGAIKVRVRRKGLFKFTLGTAITIANVGDAVCLVDDQTVDLAANTTNDIACGTIREYIDTTHAWIDIG